MTTSDWDHGEVGEVLRDGCKRCRSTTYLQRKRRRATPTRERFTVTCSLCYDELLAEEGPEAAAGVVWVHDVVEVELADAEVIARHPSSSPRSPAISRPRPILPPRIPLGPVVTEFSMKRRPGS